MAVSPLTLHDRFRAVNGFSSAECLGQVERIIHSSELHGADGLSKLLLYLAHHTLNSPEDHLKEYQIATEVLGRSLDFDPQADSSVRVQVGRLRNRLATYYTSTGINDPILITVPKGRYVLSFEHRVISPEFKPERESVIVASPRPPSLRSWRSSIVGLLAVTAFLLASGRLIYLLHARSAASSAARSTFSRQPAAFATFWSPFFQGQGGPFVVYSNASFIGNPLVGMRYYNPSKDSVNQVSQFYTGVGEVIAAVELDRLFNQFGKQFRLKRGGLFTLDDALKNDLIFLGAPTENPPLDRIPNTREFVFRRLPGDKTRWWDIVDLHPPAGKPSVYRSTLEPTSPVSEDFAVIALVHGLDPSRRTLILEGISTLGTQAAVDYVCNPETIEELLHKLGVEPGAAMPSFEALLQIKVANNVPLTTQLIDLRKIAN